MGPGLEPEEYSCDGKCRVGAAYALRTSYTGGVDAPRTHSTDNCGKTVEMVDIGVCTRWWKKDMPWNRADAGSTSANENRAGYAADVVATSQCRMGEREELPPRGCPVSDCQRMKDSPVQVLEGNGKNWQELRLC